MGGNASALKWFAIVNKWPHGSVPMLKFDKQWRFDSPGAIPGAVISAFQDFIGVIANQGSEKGTYEHFKSYFGGAAGISGGWSSSASWAQSGLYGTWLRQPKTRHSLSKPSTMVANLLRSPILNWPSLILPESTVFSSSTTPGTRSILRT